MIANKDIVSIISDPLRHKQICEKITVKLYIDINQVLIAFSRKVGVKILSYKPSFPGGFPYFFLGGGGLQIRKLTV